MKHNFTLNIDATHVDTYDNIRCAVFTLTESATHVTHFDNIRKAAFTLAEVLITLGIIGIVAAMTMPTLIANYKNKVLVNQAKNSYSLLSNALMLSKSRNGYDSYGDLFNNSRTDDEIIDILSKDLKMTKICKANKGGCINWKTKYKKKTYRNGKTVYQDLTKKSSAVLSDGSVVMLNTFNHNGDCNWVHSYNKVDDKGNPVKDGNGNNIVINNPETRCGHIIIDVNGAKGPNQLDADTWDIGVYPQYIGTKGALKFLNSDKLEYENYQEGEE